MPIIKSAKKKLRQDSKRTKRNKQYEAAYKKILDQIRKHKKGAKADELLKKAYKAIDKAAKKKVIHKNKANRLKSMASRILHK